MSRFLGIDLGTQSLKAIVYDRESREIAAAPGADGVVVLPFYNGERTPNLPNGKGYILGLNDTNMTPANIVRASMESAIFGLRAGIEALARAHDTLVDQDRRDPADRRRRTQRHLAPNRGRQFRSARCACRPPRREPPWAPHSSAANSVFRRYGTSLPRTASRPASAAGRNGWRTWSISTSSSRTTCLNLADSPSFVACSPAAQSR